MTIQLKLSEVQVFRFLRQIDLEHLSQVGIAVERQAGDSIIIRGHDVPGIYIVGEGTAGVYPTNTEKPLFVLSPGSSVGEMSFLEATKASATIRAESDNTRFAFFAREDLERAMATHDGLGQRLYQGIAVALSQKLRHTTDRISGEITKGRELLVAIGHRDLPGTTKTETQTEEYTHDVLTILAECQETINTLSLKIPEKAGSLGELGLRITEASQIHRNMIPSLLAKTELVTKYLDNIDEFLTLSTTRG